MTHQFFRGRAGQRETATTDRAIPAGMLEFFARCAADRLLEAAENRGLPADTRRHLLKQSRFVMEHVDELSPREIKKFTDLADRHLPPSGYSLAELKEKQAALEATL